MFLGVGYAPGGASAMNLPTAKIFRYFMGGTGRYRGRTLLSFGFFVFLKTPKMGFFGSFLGGGGYPKNHDF